MCIKKKKRKKSRADKRSNDDGRRGWLARARALDQPNVFRLANVRLRSVPPMLYKTSLTALPRWYPPPGAFWDDGLI